MHDVVVREVEDARQSVKSMVKKDPDAVWVTGLAPEDNRIQRRELPPSADIFQKWLKYSKCFALLALFVLVWECTFLSDSLALQFPDEEENCWDSVRNLTECDSALRILASFVYFLFVGAMCTELGAAADSLVVFCGVGCVALALIAAVVDEIFLQKACILNVHECNVPLIFHWVCGILRYGGPALGTMASSYAWDYLLTHWLRKWLLITALPVICVFWNLLSMMYFGKPNREAAAAAQISLTVVWSMLAIKCFTQNPFRVVVKHHAD